MDGAMSDKVLLLVVGALTTLGTGLALMQLRAILGKLGSIDDRLASFLKFQGVTETTMGSHGERITKLEARSERCPLLSGGAQPRDCGPAPLRAAER